MVFTKRQSNEEKMSVSALLSFLDIPIANSFRYIDINTDVDTAQLYKAYGNGVCSVFVGAGGGCPRNIFFVRYVRVFYWIHKEINRFLPTDQSKSGRHG